MQENKPLIMMTPQDYLGMAMRTAKVFEDHLDNYNYVALGLMSEAGELAEVSLCEAAGIPLPKYHHDYDAAHRAELGDLYWFFAFLLNTHAADMYLALPGQKDLLSKLLAGDRDLVIINSGPKCTPPDLAFWPSKRVAEIGGPALISSAVSFYGTLVKRAVVYGEKIPYAAYYNAAVVIGRALRDATENWFGYTCHGVRAENIDKLKHRYPEAYTDQLAKARLDMPRGA